jgi:hypothetical protein
MERLLLLNVQNSDVYKGIEPQWFDDEMHGRGLLVILYRVDGKVDVYHQATVRPNPDGYAQLEAGLGEMVVCNFERAHFTIGRGGVNADIAFRDQAGREIAVAVREKGQNRAGRFALLAPLGHSIENPEEMPLFFLYDFSFVRVRGTELAFTVDGTRQKIPKLPVPMGGGRVYIARYCADPLIAFWNPAQQGPLPGAAVDGPGAVTMAGVEYEVVEDNGRYALAAMAAGRPGHAAYPARQVRVTFDPPLPNVTELADGEAIAGRFTAASAPEAGRVSGTWAAERRGRQATLRLRADDGWQPGEPSLTPRLIFFLIRPFKQWPKTFEWTATIDLDGDPAPTIDSRWRRV